MRIVTFLKQLNRLSLNGLTLINLASNTNTRPNKKNFKTGITQCDLNPPIVSTCECLCDDIISTISSFLPFLGYSRKSKIYTWRVLYFVIPCLHM